MPYDITMKTHKIIFVMFCSKCMLKHFKGWTLGSRENNKCPKHAQMVHSPKVAAKSAKPQK